MVKKSIYENEYYIHTIINPITDENNNQLDALEINAEYCLILEYNRTYIMFRLN